jgi:CheY-like chemotaxis protein
MMSGEISLQSAVGQGSTFTFTARFQKNIAPAAPAPLPTAWQGCRTLLIQPESGARALLVKELKDLGFTVETATNESQLIPALKTSDQQNRPVQLVIADVRAGPAPDQLRATIKAAGLIKEPRLVGLVAFNNRMPNTHSSAAIFDAMLSKPVKQQQLYSILENLFAAPTSSHSPQGHIKAAPSPTLEPLPSLRILVAEDNRVNQRVALGFLERLGFSAGVAGDGTQVLTAIETSHYDIVLMDCHMPIMDGYEATRLIREREADLTRPCPWKAPLHIIATTANVMEGDRQKCIDAGMDDYLCKPVRLNDLHAALSRFSKRPVA